MLKLIKNRIRKKIKVFSLRSKNINLKDTVNFKDEEKYLNRNISVEEFTNIRKSYIGSYTYIGSSCYLPSIKIGRFCSIGSNIKAMIMDHPVDLISTHPIFYESDIDNKIGENLFEENQEVNLKKGVTEEYKIVIGNDVWIGDNVVIMPGVTIGDGAIVGTGAIVTKSVPPYAIAVGVPAKVKRYRFSKNEIDKLLKLKWWDKDFEWLKEHKELFLNPKEFFCTLLKEEHHL